MIDEPTTKSHPDTESDIQEDPGSAQPETQTSEARPDAQSETQTPESSRDEEPATHVPECSADDEPEAQTPESSPDDEPETHMPESSSDVEERETHTPEPAVPLEQERAAEFPPEKQVEMPLPPEISHGTQIEMLPTVESPAEQSIAPPPKPALSELQFELARIRTSAALDRTLLAWVRTSLSLICFGFTLARVVHELITHGSLSTIDEQTPLTLGVGMMLLGMFGLIVGSLEHMRSVRRLRITSAHFPWSAALWVTLGLIFIGFILMGSLLKDLGPIKHSIHY